MRRFSLLLSVTLLVTMILAACGGAQTSTSLPTQNVPATIAEDTATSEVGTATATEVPTGGIPTETPGTPGIPVTGAGNSDRLSNMLNFTVWDQSGKQVGKVNDMVLDLSKARVLYVVVSAEKKIAVPWAFLKVGSGSTSGSTSGEQNAFILQTDTDTFNKAPEFDVKNMPQLGAEPDSWDIRFRKYWNQGGATSGNNTPAAAGTAVSDTTATATGSGNGTATGTGNATSTSAASGNTGQGTGTGQGATSIQGVQLASQVLNAKLTVGAQGLLGTSTPDANAGGATGQITATAGTSTPGTGTTGSTTSTPGTGTALATSTSSTATGAATSAPEAGTNVTALSATINDLIVNTDSGEILYIAIRTNFDDGEHIIPVPLNLFKLDSNNEAFVLNTEAAVLQNAPSFQSDQFPDMTTPGWNSEFNSFWQNNGSGGTGNGSGTGTGSGSGAQATATP